MRTKALTHAIAESISLGLTDEESALIAGIKPETLCRWRRIPEFDQALKRATAIRLQDRLFLINSRVENWQAIGWLIERQYPTLFSKPEIQISLSNSLTRPLTPSRMPCSFACVLEPGEVKCGGVNFTTSPHTFRFKNTGEPVTCIAFTCQIIATFSVHLSPHEYGSV